MKSRWFPLLSAISLMSAVTANAAGIDMKDPRRAVAREDDIRIDAQLVSDTVSPGAPVGVMYQIQNLSKETVAVADKVSDASYDVDTRTITVGIGSEVPGETMPHMVKIAPGEKKVLRASAVPTLNVQATRTAFAIVPRYVQVKVTVLRDLEPFATMIEDQSHAQALPDALFDRWIEGSDTIFLNTLPVQWSPRGAALPDIEQRSLRGTF